MNADAFQPSSVASLIRAGKRYNKLLKSYTKYDFIKILSIITFTLALILPETVGAEIYRWVDEDGNVYYSDIPSGDNAEEVPIVHQQSTIDHVRLKKRQRLLDVMREERQQRDKDREDLRAAAEERRQKCDVAKAHLQKILNSSFLYEDTGDPLNPRILSFEERNTAIENARSAVRKWCGSDN